MLPFFFTKVEEKADVGREDSSSQLGHEFPESKVSCRCSARHQEGHWPGLGRALLGAQADPIHSHFWETEHGLYGIPER